MSRELHVCAWFVLVNMGVVMGEMFLLFKCHHVAVELCNPQTPHGCHPDWHPGPNRISTPQCAECPTRVSQAPAPEAWFPHPNVRVFYPRVSHPNVRFLTHDSSPGHRNRNLLSPTYECPRPFLFSRPMIWPQNYIYIVGYIVTAKPHPHHKLNNFQRWMTIRIVEYRSSS